MSLLRQAVRRVPRATALTAAAAVVVFAQPAHSAMASARHCGQLGLGESLARGEVLRACNGDARIVHQSDGNVVVYRGEVPVSATGTAGLATGSFAMRRDGNLVLTAPNGTVLRQSHMVADVPDWALRLFGDGHTCIRMEIGCHHYPLDGSTLAGPGWS